MGDCSKIIGDDIFILVLVSFNYNLDLYHSNYVPGCLIARMNLPPSFFAFRDIFFC